MPGSFFDTNVLAYFASLDTSKSGRAEELMAEGGTISVQILNEMANVARRKFKMSWPETFSVLTAIKYFLEIRPITLQVHEAGMLLAQKFQLAIYDAVIVASALDAGCDTLWSEDMQDGMVFENRLKIVNPFRAA
jgi:predicted nucleic acid-binding protein